MAGHDFGYILGLNSGARIFLRALRAMRTIGATRLAECMAEIRDHAVAKGVVFPDPLPDPWIHDIAIDYDMESELNRLTRELNPYEGLNGGDLHKMVVDYLRRHVDVLRQRKIEPENH